MGPAHTRGATATSAQTWACSSWRALSTMVTIATARVVGEDCFVVDESAKAPSPSERR